jgi:hypothetical protein
MSVSINCKECETKTHKIYWDEMSEKNMELYGVSYHKCNSCSFEPLIWNMGIGDAVCENCGKWQEEDN